jgi:ATP adenylyltransferase
VRGRPAVLEDIEVQHEQLWAPWRLGYIKGDDAKNQPVERPRTFLSGADSGCFICRGVAEAADRENLIVQRTDHSVVVLNRYPYNNGHLLIAPLQHKGRLEQLTDPEQLDGQKLLAQHVQLIEQLMNAEGFNIGLNLGRVAGAGLPGHLHWHIVPRWNGDTNFMSVLGATDVIPQSLDALWEILTAALRNPAAAGSPTRKAKPEPPAR